MVLRRMVPKNKFKKTEIVWVETASWLQETNRKIGGEAPHFFRWISRRQEAVSTPRIDEFGNLYFGAIRRSTLLRVTVLKRARRYPGPESSFGPAAHRHDATDRSTAVPWSVTKPY